MLPLQTSAVRAAAPPLSVPLQGRGGPPPLPSAVRTHAPLFSAMLPQRVKPPLQPSAVNISPVPHILTLPLHRYVLTFQPLSARAPHPRLSVSLQGRGEPPLLYSAVRAYVPLIYALILRQGVPLRYTSAETAPLTLLSALLTQQVEPPLQTSAVNPPPLPQLPALPLSVHTPLPQLSDFPLQRGMPTLQTLATCAPPPLSVLLQGIVVPSLLHSAVRAYAHLLW